MKKQLGAIYLALGRPYLSMALLSAKSLVYKNPDFPYTIVTNVVKQPPDVDFFRKGFDKWIYINEDTSKNRTFKTSILKYSEYEKTLFLDCDTIIMGDLSPASKILDYFDVAVRLNRYPQKRMGKGDVRVLGETQVTDLPHWNSGVMLIRSSTLAQAFFDDWYEKFRTLGVKYDQVALVPVIFESKARVLSLEERWNATDPGLGRKKWRKEARIYHYATNICDHLFREILEMDNYILSETDSEQDTRDFLKYKRKLKKSQMSLFRYVVINMLWKFSSPVNPDIFRMSEN